MRNRLTREVQLNFNRSYFNELRGGEGGEDGGLFEFSSGEIPKILWISVGRTPFLIRSVGRERFHGEFAGSFTDGFPSGRSKEVSR